jgi:hypothetical protein
MMVVVRGSGTGVVEGGAVTVILVTLVARCKAVVGVGVVVGAAVRDTHCARRECFTACVRVRVRPPVKCAVVRACVRACAPVVMRVSASQTACERSVCVCVRARARHSGCTRVCKMVSGVSAVQ